MTILAVGHRCTGGAKVGGSVWQWCSAGRGKFLKGSEDSRQPPKGVVLCPIKAFAGCHKLNSVYALFLSLSASFINGLEYFARAFVSVCSVM